jgi:hypothetical protein
MATPKFDEIVKPILAIMIVLLTFTYFFTMFIITGQADPQAIIAIVAMSAGATGYYFGASSGSARKDNTIQQMAQNTSSNQ